MVIKMKLIFTLKERTFNVNLKETREKYNLSRPELARLFQDNGYDVPLRSIQNWETDRVSARRTSSYTEKLLVEKLEELMKKEDDEKE